MTAEFPAIAPAMILPDVALFPGGMLPLYIFEPRYRQMLRDVLAGDRLFVVVARRADALDETPTRFGCLGMVRASVDNADGTSHLFLFGLRRVIVRELLPDTTYPVVRIDPAPDEDGDSVRAHALVLKVKELARERVSREEPPAGLRELAARIVAEDSPTRLADLLAHLLITDPARKQELLAMPSVPGRLEKLAAFLMEKA